MARLDLRLRRGEGLLRRFDHLHEAKAHLCAALLPWGTAQRDKIPAGGPRANGGGAAPATPPAPGL
jgi:hypothetical protein